MNSTHLISCFTQASFHVSADRSASVAAGLPVQLGSMGTVSKQLSYNGVHRDPSRCYAPTLSVICITADSGAISMQDCSVIAIKIRAVTYMCSLTICLVCFT